MPSTTYVSISEEPLAYERLDDRGLCQPSFYIIGAMKAASTYMAEVLTTVGLDVHKHEHHFWEYYPAFEWETGGDDRASSHRWREGVLSQQMLDAEAALVPALQQGNGSYPPHWSGGYPSRALQPCIDVVRGLAPRSATNLSSSARDVCAGAQGTLATSMAMHAYVLPRSLWLRPSRWLANASSSPVSALARNACKEHGIFGVKAPSHISEYYVPLRISACAAPTVRFLVSLRDPVERAYSAWRYVNRIPSHQAAFDRVNAAFAHAVELELRGLRHVDLWDGAVLGQPHLWMELYLRLLWQGALRDHMRDTPQDAGSNVSASTPSDVAGRPASVGQMPLRPPPSPSPTAPVVKRLVRCRPNEYGGHDKLAGLIKGFYVAQLRHWLGAFGNDCSRFLITLAEVHMPPGDLGDSAGVDSSAVAAIRANAFQRILDFIGVNVDAARLSKALAKHDLAAAHSTRPTAAAYRMQNRTESTLGTAATANSRPAASMPRRKRALANTMYRQLAAFYAPANAALADLLETHCRCVPLDSRGASSAASSTPVPRGGLMQMPANVVDSGRGQWLVEGGSSRFRHRFVTRGPRRENVDV